VAITFPVSKDNLSNPAAQDELAGHAQQHSDANDAIEAIENVIGVTNSTDSNSITYKVNNLSTLVDNLGNTSDLVSELLGLDGNNDLEINAIENVTVIDSFAIDTWKSAKYHLQVTTGAYWYSSTMTVVQDGVNANVSEYDIMSNTNINLASFNFEDNAGIMDLVVTPLVPEISVRFMRTALKI
jgi:hypothetical protein